MELEDALRLHVQTLAELLSERKHGAARFFEALIELVDNDPEECIERIMPAYTMTQHSGFTFEEEEAFDRLWRTADAIKKR